MDDLFCPSLVTAWWWVSNISISIPSSLVDRPENILVKGLSNVVVYVQIKIAFPAILTLLAPGGVTGVPPQQKNPFLS